MPTPRTRARLLALPVALLVACAGNDPVMTGSPPTDAPEQAGPPAPTSPAATAPGPTGALATKPVVEVPDGPPPTELEIRDIVAGTGPEAKSGQIVSVQYVGVSYSTKKQFDSSWDRGAKPIDFPIGVGRVIEGWDQGVPGMKVGGRRELIIPPGLGYGNAGSPPDIKPGETLVFVIDLVGLR